MKNQLTKEQFINIPYSIMMNKKLSQSAKMIYGFINGFNSKQVCYASNAHIASIIDISEDNVSRSITSLKTTGLITSTRSKGRSRALFTTDSPAENDGHEASKTTDNNIVNNINHIIVNKEHVDDLTKVKTIGTWTGTKPEWDSLSPGIQNIHKSQH